MLDGLAENTQVVMNTTDDLREGVQVQVEPAENQKLAAASRNHLPADELRSKAISEGTIVGDGTFYPLI